MRAIYTVGYEGSTIEDFIETLRLAGIELVVDVRDLPLSRKRGFSKRALGEHLVEAGLQYLHVKALGDPKPGREAAKQGDLVLFRRIFGKHMKSELAQAAISDIAELARTKTICLLCFERSFSCCHRSIVADALSKDFGAKIRHIGVRSGLATSEGIRDAVAVRALAIG